MDDINGQKPSSQIVVLSALVVVLGAIIASLLILEVAFRALKPKKADRWSDRPLVYSMPENAPSMQDQAYPTEKPSGTFRIAVVGDSFTFGPNMQFYDTFPKRMERMLNLNTKPQKIEVMNYGFSGYNTQGEVAVVSDAIRNHSDLVVLEITLNDAEPHPLSKEEKAQLFDAPYLRSPFFQYWQSLGFILGRIHNSVTHKNFIRYHSEFFEKQPTAKIFADSLKQIATLCSGSGTKVAAMIFPLFDFRMDEHYPFTKTHQIIGERLNDASIPYLDLSSAYTNIPPDRLQVIPGVDSHPNEIAHRIAAERLIDFLTEKSLLPQESLPLRNYKARKNIKERRISKK